MMLAKWSAYTAHNLWACSEMDEEQTHNSRMRKLSCYMDGWAERGMTKAIYQIRQ